MTTKLEQVARAICCPDGCEGDTGSGRPCNIAAEDRTSMRQARAAIEALRTPTPEMVKAGCDEYAEGDENQYPVENGISDAWDAMIDEALIAPRDTQGKKITPGYYWAQWHTATDDTPDGDQLAGGEWEIVQVNDNNGELGSGEELSVAVPGVAVTQWLDCFVWGARVANLRDA